MESLGNTLRAHPYASLAILGFVVGAQVCSQHLPGLGWVILGGFGLATGRQLLRSLAVPPIG
ncbi:MAG: hypothetical protein ACKO5K_15300 [Armatimonadota bacterium]